MIKLPNKLLHFVILSLTLLLSQLNYAQFNIPQKPQGSKQTSVYDYANILSTEQRNLLERQLIDYANETSTQIVFISIESLEGESIDLLGPKWGHTWGIGQKGQDNGVILLFANKERRFGIYPGYGAESYITAGQGGELIRNRVIPEFKNGNYFQGIENAVEGVREMLLGIYQNDNPVRMEGDNSIGGLFCLFIIIALIVGTILFSKDKNDRGGKGGGGGKRQRSFGSDLADIIILSNLGRRSGGGSGWGSGGGFGGGGSFGGGGGFSGGFGGGGFSGGGSSGSW